MNDQHVMLGVCMSLTNRSGVTVRWHKGNFHREAWMDFYSLINYPTVRGAIGPTYIRSKYIELNIFLSCSFIILFIPEIIFQIVCTFS